MEARVLVSVRKPEDVDKVVKAILLLAKEHGVAIVNPASIFNLAWDISFALRGRDKESGPSVSRDEFVRAGRDSMRRFLYANVSNDTGIVMSGQEFSKISPHPYTFTL